MQSQEGMPQKSQAREEYMVNTDPREQPQWRESSPSGEPERPYAEGYTGADMGEDMWTWGREGEKLRPRSQQQQQNIQWLLLFIVLFSLVVIGGTMLGFLIHWWSWLLLTAIITAAITTIIRNWRSVMLPQPIRTFEVMEQPQLVMRNTAGSVSVRRGESGVISVAATKRISGVGIEPEKTQVQCTLQNNTLNVGVQSHWHLFQFGMNRVDFEITVPAGCNLQIDNGWGNVAVNGLQGRIKLRTGSGKINADDIEGEIALKTGSGSISASHLAGPLVLTTGSGKINIDQSMLTERSGVKTGSGAIKFEGTLHPRGHYTFKSGSGSVTMRLPSESAFSLDAKTGSGGVRNEFGNNETGSGPRAQLKIRTGSGRISMQRAETTFESF